MTLQDLVDAAMEQGGFMNSEIVVRVKGQSYEDLLVVFAEEDGRIYITEL